MKHIWKVAGKYEVIAVMEVEDGDQMDAALHALPIWQEGFAHVISELEWTPLRNYQNWSNQLKDLAEG
jgi:muconolactone delta-isomerase